jgi:hypothetical protein
MFNKNLIQPITIADDVSVLNEKYGIKAMIVNGELLNTDGTPFTNFPSDFEAKRQELIDEYNAGLYRKKRTQQYPKIADQLDMLWHEINNNGGISADGEWFNRIKGVKEDNPKN